MLDGLPQEGRLRRLPVLDMDFIHPWIGLGWTGFGQDLGKLYGLGRIIMVSVLGFRSL